MRRGRWGVVVVLALLAGACGGDGAPFAGEVDALARAFASGDGGDLDEPVAECVATELVGLLDADDLRELEGPPEEVLDADLDDLGLDPDDGDDLGDVADGFEDCDVDLDDIDADDLRGLAGEAAEMALQGAYAEAIEQVAERDELLEGASRGDRRCVGRGLVIGLGLEAVADAGAPDEIEDADAVAELRFDVDDLDEVAAALEPCDLDLEDLAEEVLVADAFLSDGDASCMTGELGEDLTRRLGAAALVLGAEEASFGLDGDLQDALFDAFGACVEDFGDFDDVPDFDDDEYVASLTSALLEDPVPATPEQASCLAATWTRDLGEGFFAEVLAIEPSDLLVLDDLPQLGFVDDDVELLLDAAEACQVAIPGLALAVLETPVLTAEQMTCFLGALGDPIVAAAAVEDLLTGELDDGDDVGAAVAAALTGCGIAG